MNILLASYQARFDGREFTELSGQNESLSSLSGLLQNQHSVDIWTPPPTAPSWQSFFYTQDLISEAKKQRADLVYLALPTPNFYFIADNIKRKIDKDMVVRYNSTLIKNAPPFPHDLFEIRWIAEKTIINNVINGKLLSSLQPPDKDQNIIVSTEYQRDRLVAIMGFDSSQVKVIPNTSAADLLHGSSEKETADGSEKVTFGYMGHSTPVKGVGDLLEAFSRLDGDAELLLAFSGRGALSHEKQRNVEVLGKVDKDWFFSKIDALVLPYRRVFGTQIVPNTLLEGLYTGTPILTTDLPYMDELFVSGEHALLYPPGRISRLVGIMERFCDDESLRKDLSNNEIPEKLRPEKIKEEMEEFFREILN